MYQKDNFHRQQRLVHEWANNFKHYSKSMTNVRFSTFQAIAFRALKSITKYGQFFKRDGSIIRNLKTASGQIITDQELVNSEQVGVLIHEMNFMNLKGFLKKGVRAASTISSL